MKHGKKYRASAAKYDLTKKYDVAAACHLGESKWQQRR